MPPSKKVKTRRPWQDVAQEAREYRDASIARLQPPLPELPKELPKNIFATLCEALDPEETRITEALPEDLLARLASGNLTATAVTTAFLRRAGLAQKLVFLH